ncbi:unnamed protein product [Durusdinium trenchii]|uniref:Uncharacterized protein n=1 Tax=Durusdinium trenchii TaxID=1381693 RepID=A0ABP0JT14_9DINO
MKAADAAARTSRFARGRFRAVALDLDGTTLNEVHALSERTLKAIQRVEAAGVQVILATGRPLRSLQPYVAQLTLQRPVPTVCFNGTCAALFDPKEAAPQVLLSRGLTRSAAESIIQMCDDRGWCASYCLPNSTSVCLTTELQAEWLQKFEEIEDLRQERVESLWELLEYEPPLKIVALAEEPFTQAAKARAMLPPGAAHVVAAEMHIEFLPADVNKGDTLLRLCNDHLGIRMDEVIAFGDNYNDMEMLTLAGEGVAMKNAKDELKEAANRVSEWSNDEDAVARELERLLEE